MVRQRGRLREGLDTAKLVTQPMRGRLVRGSVSLSSIEAIGVIVDLVETAPHLAGVAFSAAARSGEPGGKG